MARTLGAGPQRVFLRVALPLARPAIAVGVSLALMETLNDIGASEFLGVRTLTVVDLHDLDRSESNLAGAAQIALVMLAVVFSLVLVERWARRRQRYSGHGAAAPRADAAAASRLAGAGARFACGRADRARLHRSGELSRRCVVAARRCRRHPALVWRVDRQQRHARGDRHSRRRRWSACRWSPMRRGCNPAAPRRWSGSRRLGYAVPGTVLAVGLLVPLAGSTISSTA